MGAMLTWFRSVKRRGRLCPQCASTTVSLVPGLPLRLLGKGVVARWCAGCGWKGMGFRPSHESLGPGGKVHLKGSFQWGSPPPPPNGFFNWSGQKGQGPGLNSRDDLDSLPAEGSEHTIPGFQWRDKPASPPSFQFADQPGDAPKEPEEVDVPPPLPFRFADQPEKAPGPSPIKGLPLSIPFKFAEGKEEAKQESPLDPGNPRKISPKLGFRWRG